MSRCGFRFRRAGLARFRVCDGRNIRTRLCGAIPDDRRVVVNMTKDRTNRLSRVLLSFRLICCKCQQRRRHGADKHGFAACYFVRLSSFITGIFW